MVKLECLEKEDLEKVVKWNSDKSAEFLLQWAGPMYSYPLTIKQVEDYYFSEVMKVSSNILLYKIKLTDSGEVIGTIELREVDKENKIGMICRFLIGEENFRNKGIGAQALKEILKIGFNELKFEKIALRVFDFNHGAIKCYEKAGFVKEKFLENARKTATTYWNLYEMSISKDEWKIKNE